MKYIVLIGDGMADEPIARLDGRTPMSAAAKPYMNYLASMGINGEADTVPEGMTPESDTANLAIMGYDPRRYSRGRSPLEAASMGIEMADDETAIRANLVSLSDNGEPYEEKIMLDHSSDEIPTEQAAELIAAVGEKFGSDTVKFYPGVSYRHCVIYKNCPQFDDFTRPHDILGKTIKNYLPCKSTSEVFTRMQKESFELLNEHPVNLMRASQGLKKANSLWFWGPGKKPSLPAFSDKYGLKATVVSAVDLIKGIGKCAGMHVAEVPGATGTIDTNYRGKMEAAAEALLTGGSDLVYVHVEAPDECGHRGELMNKIKAIELIDSEILGPLLRRMDESGEDYSVMVLPDHPTPIRARTHTHAPVPFVIYRKSEAKPSGVRVYDEESGRNGLLHISDGFDLMDLFIRG
ncbi:MAG: cofactor-independent phosphoglycerate mutase [Clostridiales bacterium]|nr:MAG: cofactor-independent phosphoglycerate mutase [Clostridiales bacterium]